MVDDPSKKTFRLAQDGMREATKAMADAVQNFQQATRALVPGKHVEAVTNVTIKTYWYSAEQGRVIHRGAILHHDGEEVAILWCDVNQRVEQRNLVQHLEGTGPTVTCLWCATGIRRD